MDFFGIGPMELFLIIILALIVFGPGKMPEMARQLGRAVREFKKASTALTQDFKEEFNKELNAEPDKPKPAGGESGVAKTAPPELMAKAEANQPQNGNQN